MRRLRLILGLFVVAVLLIVLAGCGGSSNSGGTPNVVTVSIDQASPVSVQVNGSVQFSATVTGTTNTAVTWSVQEGASGGSFSPTTSGLYTAPGTTGTFHVIATSVADTQKTDTVTVNVTSGNVNTPPTASFTVSPASGPVSTNFAVDASASSDAQDAVSALEVRWDWENDGVWDTVYGTTKTASHTYSSTGTFTIKLEARDTGGLLGTTTRIATVTGSAVTFTLTLDGTVDTSSGSVKAATFTSADLLNTSGSSVKTGTVSGTTANFDLTGLVAGTYFVRVNGLSNDLVPVRIDNTSVSGTAFVGTRLRDVLIGSKATPTYRIKTFSQGQGATSVVKYSDGTQAMPVRYSYAILFLQASPRRVEIRTLGTGALLSSHVDGGEHNIATWALGPSNHGISYGGNDGRCNGCHSSLDTHPATYAAVDDGNGWCFKCHFGKIGTSAGPVDPAQ